MNRRQRKNCRSLGITTGGVLMTTLVFGALGAAAVTVGPRVIVAGTGAGAGTEQMARQPEHQHVIELFGSMVARSHAVLAWHERGDTPFEELVLWLNDRDRPGAIDEDEVGVVSHSRILQTLTFYTQEEAEIAPPVDEQRIRDTSFCDAWRTNPERRATVIASGISDVRYDYEQLIQGEPPSLRITFTWASDSVDGSDEASILVDVAYMDRHEDGGAGVRRNAS